MAGTVEQLCEDETFLQTEYFRMFEFKVRRCPKAKPHDWTQCPFAHPTEKAKRRGPTKYKYNGTACADFRKNGSCRRGDACPFAHGVFEAWLHPARYRTKLCTDGEKCVRRVCFFASKEEQLREPTPEGLEPVIALRDELLDKLRAEPHFTKQLDLLFALEPPAPAVEPQDEEMPAHPETVQGHVTTLDLLRELELRAQQEQSQQYLGTPRRQMLSGLPQYPSQGLENELFQKMSLRQALREDMLAAQSTRMSLDMLGPSSSLGSVDAILARRLNSLPPLSPHQAIHPFANNWSGNDASNGLFSHGGLNSGSENQSRMSEDWMSINITPTNPSNRSSSDTVSPYHQFGCNGNGLNSYMMSNGQQQQQQAQGSNMRLEDMLNAGSLSSNQSDAVGMRLQSGSLFNQQPLPFDHGMQMNGSAFEDGYGYQNFQPPQSQMPAGPSADQESFLAMLAHTQAHSSAGMFGAAALGEAQGQAVACSRTANISNKFALAPARLPSSGIDHSPSVDDMLREIPSTLADLA